MLVVCVYNSPHGSPYRLSLDEWSDILDMACQDSNNCCEILICGDFNMPAIDWTTLTSDDSYCLGFLELLDTHHLEQRVDFSTRGANTLDLVLTKYDLVVGITADRRFHYWLSV